MFIKYNHILIRYYFCVQDGVFYSKHHNLNTSALFSLGLHAHFIIINYYNIFYTSL